MKLLLTSGGLTNKTLVASLADLVSKPFSEARVVFVPTAAHPERGDKMWLVNDLTRLGELGWQKLDIIDLAAVNGLARGAWWSAFEEADVIVVGGGNTYFLSYWFQKSGLMDALPGLLKSRVYVGISAGTMVVSAGLRTSGNTADDLVDPEYDETGPKNEASQKTAKIVNFMIRPHYTSSEFPKINDAHLQQVAGELAVPMYAIDDQSAVRVVDGDVTVVGEGAWRKFHA